jgi:hypothetical protein
MNKNNKKVLFTIKIDLIIIKNNILIDNYLLIRILSNVFIKQKKSILNNKYYK